jgi:hypothetical protein
MSDEKLQVELQIINDQFQKGLKESTKHLEHFEKEGSSVSKKFTQSFETGLKQIQVATVVAFATMTYAMIQFGKSSVDEAANLQKAMVTLEVIAPRFGQDAEEMKKQAKSLGKELRIGTTSASDGLINLLQAGLTLEQSTDLLKRFTNEAKTGKSNNIGLAEAVTNLTFAYKTNNSALGNMSGVSENFEDITKNGLKLLQQQGKLLGKTVGTLSDAEKEQAKYAGMIELTNLTMGSSDAFQDSYLDNLDLMNYEMTELKQTVGDKLMPIMNQFAEILTPLIIDLKDFVNSIDWEKVMNDTSKALEDLNVNYLQPFGNWVMENKDALVFAFAAIATVLMVSFVPAIWAATAPLLAVIGVMALVGIAAFTLYKVWSENMFGIQDTFKSVMDFLTPTFNLLGWYFGYLWSLTKTVWGAIANYFTGFILPMWQNVFAIIKFAVDLFVVGFRNAWSQLQPIVQPFLDFLQNKVAPIFNTIWSGISQGLKGGLNAFIDMLNSAFDKFNSMFNKINEGLKNIPNSKPISLQFSKIPKFRSGVENFEGGLAYVHQNEVLMNLPRGTNVIPANQVNNRLGNQEITMNVTNNNSNTSASEIAEQFLFRMKFA